jgi:prefoldin subunit 5
MLTAEQKQETEKVVARLRAIRQIIRHLQRELDVIYDDALALDDTLTDRMYEK